MKVSLSVGLPACRADPEQARSHRSFHSLPPDRLGKTCECLDKLDPADKISLISPAPAPSSFTLITSFQNLHDINTTSRIDNGCSIHLALIRGNLFRHAVKDVAANLGWCTRTVAQPPAPWWWHQLPLPPSHISFLGAALEGLPRLATTGAHISFLPDCSRRRLLVVDPRHDGTWW